MSLAASFRLTLAVAFALTLAAIPIRAKQDAAVAIPKADRKLLDEKWKGWQLATIDSQRLTCRQTDAASPAIAQADLDSDGRSDVAVAVKTVQGTRLVVILNRLGSGTLFDVDSLGDAASTGFIVVAHRGTKFKKTGGIVEDNFAQETITVVRCGEGTTAYLWNGLGFTKIPLA